MIRAQPSLDARDAQVTRAPAWPVLVVVVATVIVFAPLCVAEFTWWDDYATVHQNPRMNPPTLGSIAHYWTHPAGGLYVPVTYTAWAALAAIARLDVAGEHGIALNPWLFHGANVVVHLLAALTAYALLRRLTRHDAASCVGALLFALHPVQVETVGWISGLKDLLAGCLALVALLCYTDAATRERQSGRQFTAPYVLAVLALIAAMLAKPSVVVVPLLAGAIDLLILRRPLRRVTRGAGPMLVLTIPIILVARLAQDVEAIPTAPIWARPLIAGDALAFYLYKLVLPLRLGIDYGRRPDVVLQSGWIWIAWLVPGALFLLLALERKHRPWLLAGGLVLGGGLLPVLGLATFQFQGISTTADHYLYLAMLGPAIILAFALREHARRAGWAIACVALVLLAGRSLAQTLVWQDDLALFGNAAAVNPRSLAAHNGVAQAYQRAGNDTRALEHFQRAMIIAPEHPTAYESAALLHARRGEWQRAVEAMEHALTVRPQWPGFDPHRAADDHVRLGQILLMSGQHARAVAHGEAALRLDPGNELAQQLFKDAKHAAGPSGQP